MTNMMVFRFIDCRNHDGEWQQAFNRYWPAYKRWFLSNGIEQRETLEACEKAIHEQMPELGELYHHLCQSAGNHDLAARFLSMYCPPAYLTGCSQLATWTGGHPVLIRNYDYSPRLFEATVMLTNWSGKLVIATIDSLWGCLDGVNEDGLAVSLTFGGSRKVGTGFGIPIILRYLLQTCGTAAEAVSALKRVTCNMAYNVTLTDCTGDACTVELFPDHPIALSNETFAANHQSVNHWPAYTKKTRSVERMAVLRELNANHRDTEAQAITEAFQTPPLRSDTYDRGFGTLYTCMLHPRKRSVDYFWGYKKISQSIKHFDACDVQIGLTRPSDGIGRLQPPTFFTED